MKAKFPLCKVGAGNYRGQDAYLDYGGHGGLLD
jgi:hypothetical protein